MKKIFTLFTFLTLTTLSYSQIVVRGLYPSAIKKDYKFSYADPNSTTSTTKWGSPDFTIDSTFIVDTLVLTDDGTTGNDSYGIKKAYQSCSPVVANKYKGKIAVIYRGSCNFDDKVYNAQQAGAVGAIIVNRVDSLFGMSAATKGPQITIPVVSLKQSDGQDLINRLLNNDTLVMLIGNKIGYYNHDVAFAQGEVASPLYTSVPQFYIKDLDRYSFKINGKARFYGYQDLSNAKVRAQIKDSKGTLILDTVKNGLSVTQYGDSIDFDFGRFKFPSDKLERYKLTYTVIADELDQDTTDNKYEFEFQVDEELFSYAKIDTVKNLPITSLTAPAYSVLKSHTECIHFKDTTMNNIGVEGVYFSIGNNYDVPVKLKDTEIKIQILTWDNPFTTVFTKNLAVTNSEVSSDFYYYPNENVDSMVYAQLSTPVVLEKGKRHLICLTPSTPNVSIGFYEGYDYWTTMHNTYEAISPMFDGTANRWYTLGYGSDLAPTISIKTYEVDLSAGIQSNQLETIKVYPNPTRDNLTIAGAKDGEATITITDLAGKKVRSYTKTITGKTSVDVEGLTNGLYVLTVEQDNQVFRTTITKE